MRDRIQVAKGFKSGGRKKGTANRVTVDVAQKLQNMGYDPFDTMSKLARGVAECIHCRGAGTVHEPGQKKKQTCPRCQGSKVEDVPLELRGQMAKELAQYIAPRLKQIEYTPPPDLGDKLRDPLEFARRVLFMMELGARQLERNGP